MAYDATRMELRQKLDSLKSAIDGSLDRTGEGGDNRRLRMAARIQDRLENGDLRTGDMVSVQVGADSILSGTYRVTEARTLDVPTVGQIDVDGLLYSEVGDRVQKGLGTVVRTTRIEVQPLIRVAVLGQVNSPGYYNLPPAATVSDALMAAGGPTQSAQVQETTLRQPERGGDQEPRRVASLTGRSLADLGIGRGDEVYVPSSGGGFSFGTLTTILGVASSVVLLATRL